MEYPYDELLQLSGIQHFAFCRRQWALIHIEKLWADNYQTADGALMHDKRTIRSSMRAGAIFASCAGSA